MKRIREYLSNKPHVAIGIPTVLCSITFASNLIKALSDGVISDAEYHQLLSTADGFEVTILFIVMLVLKNKKK